MNKPSDSILRYWYYQEYLTPLLVSEIRQRHKSKKLSCDYSNAAQMPWEKDDIPGMSVTLFLGKAPLSTLKDIVYSGLGEEDDSPETVTGGTCLCALKVNEDGYYIEETLAQKL